MALNLARLSTLDVNLPMTSARRICFRLFAPVVLLAAAIGIFAGSASAQTLEDALVSAYRNNPALAAQRAGLRAVDEKTAEAASGWRPSVEATAAIGKSRQQASGNGMDTGSRDLSPADVGLTVTQPVFHGFRTRNAVDSAEAQALAGRAELKDVEQRIMFETAQAYLDVLRDQSVLELTRGNEEVLREQLSASQSRFDVGEVTKTDVSQSEARLNAAVASRLKAEGDLSNSRLSFARLTGAPPDGEVKRPDLTLDVPKDADEAAALALRNNPMVIAAAHGREAAEADADHAKGSLLPEVNIVGNLSRNWEQSAVSPDRHDQATVMARVVVPLYRAGRDYSAIRAAGQTALRRRLEEEDARAKAREEAVRAWQSLITARAAIAAYKSAVAANDMALRGVREEAKVGTRTTLDVLNAEQELLNARVELVRAERDEAVASLGVKAATGALTAEAMKLPVQTYDPAAYHDQVREKWIGLGGE